MEAFSFSIKLFFLLFLILCANPLDAAVTARSPRELANAALTASAARAREASSYVSRVSSGNTGKSPKSDRSNAFEDCTGMMAHSADRLQRSVEEMGRLGRAGSADYALHQSNVHTWVSSALTDQDMCLDSLRRAGKGSSSMAEAVRGKVAGVRVATSNALSLVNRMN